MKRPYIIALAALAVAAFLVLQADRPGASQGAEKGKGQTTLREGDILYTKPVRSVIFSHKDHLDKGLGCDMCHSGLFEPKALKAQEKSDFTMESLYKGKYCGGCHNGTMAFASNTRCAACHVGVKGHAAAGKESLSGAIIAGPKGSITLGKGSSAVKFSHERHSGMFQCADCHATTFPMQTGKKRLTMDQMYQGKSCGSCHNGTMAFSSMDCNKCHVKTPA